MYEKTRKAMTEFYRQLPASDPQLCHPQLEDVPAYAIRENIFRQMDALSEQQPELPACLLKSRLHTLIAQQFQPVIFPGCPFFFEMGLRESDSWGIGGRLAPSVWHAEKYRAQVLKKHPLAAQLEAQYAELFDLSAMGLCGIHSAFDLDHHSLGYTELFAHGINGLLLRLREKLTAFAPGSEQWSFCKAAEESCLALLTAAEKFSTHAAALLESCTDEPEARELRLIRDTAKRIPAQPPGTFYEGLAMLLFTREAVATLEHIGISQLGHIDRLLGALYEKDLRAGRITEERARELLGLWMLHTDIKFDLERNSWPETSTCIQLGGCDENGAPVYNAVTRMLIEEHHRLGLVNPKLNCRYCAGSPAEYLQTVATAILAGHNNFVLINDDVVIPGLIRSGVEEKDARKYVSGGCQETMIEGLGHTEGAALYVSVPRLVELFLNPDDRVPFMPCVRDPQSFEEFYDGFLAAAKHFFTVITDQRNVRQSFEKEWEVCPLFSATQSGCIENGTDYIYGGAKYNFSTVAVMGLATVADSLYAVKELVYEKKLLTLQQLAAALAADWAGSEELRRTAIALPKYGHGLPGPDALAARFLEDIAAHIRSLKNERGGSYIPSLFVYYHFANFSGALGATPDGRKAGSLMSPGCGPGQLCGSRDATAPVRSMQHIDFTACGGGSAVLDLKLPAGSGLSPENFAAFIRACHAFGCPTLQPNAVSQQELLDAKAHPEKHRGLIVRISGLSAYFVSLTPQVQDEIIARNVYQV